MQSKFRFLTTILAASALLSLGAEAQVVDYSMSNGILSFEDDIEKIHAVKSSILSTSTDHYKLGSHSLKWDWNKKGAFLSIDGEIPYLPENPDPKETSVSSFVFWVYAPDAMDGSLKFSFLKDGKECCHSNPHVQV